MNFARVKPSIKRRRVRSTQYHLPDYTEPEPTRWPRPPKEEGEAARNNVVMSAGKRSCPDIICYLLSRFKPLRQRSCSREWPLWAIEKAARGRGSWSRAGRAWAA